MRNAEERSSPSETPSPAFLTGSERYRNGTPPSDRAFSPPASGLPRGAVPERARIECGTGSRAERSESRCGYSEGSTADLGWQSFGEYLERLGSTPLGVNVAAFVGHGAVHRAVMGDELRTPDIDGTRTMAALLEEAFDQGAYGSSIGLEYWPGNICAPEHVIPLCDVAARRGRLYATHVRNRDAYYDLGFGEALCTARNASARCKSPTSSRSTVHPRMRWSTPWR